MIAPTEDLVEAHNKLLAITLEDRPFTADERQQILTSADVVRRFILNHERFVSWAHMGELAGAFMVGVIVTKVFLP